LAILDNQTIRLEGVLWSFGVQANIFLPFFEKDSPLFPFEGAHCTQVKRFAEFRKICVKNIQLPFFQDRLPPDSLSPNNCLPVDS
jgi:hypothetical protein